MLCEDCIHFQNMDTNNHCDNCSRYQEFIRDNEYTNVVTIDYDLKFEAFNKLISLCNYLDNFDMKALFRISSSGNGVHLKMIFNNEFSFYERIKLRLIMGDDSKRVELD
jgi:hypothetical protein